MQLSGKCIYTTINPASLSAIGQGQYAGSGKSAWVAAQRYLQQAMESGERLPIVFSNAIGSGSVLCNWGLVRSITVSKRRTDYIVDSLQSLPNQNPQQLVLLSTGKRIAKGFNRPYALVQTPKFISPNKPSALSSSVNSVRELEDIIDRRDDIRTEEKTSLLSARLGLGVFRENLEKIEPACRLTGLLDRRHMRAIHIKPWKDSDDHEKIDGFNGLLLSPHIEYLFERGYISFEDNGDLKLSRFLNPLVLEAWGIKTPFNVRAFRTQQCRYLAFHRDHVFEKDPRGVRSER